MPIPVAALAIPLTAALSLALSALLAPAARAASPEEEGRAIAVKADKANEGYQTEKATMTMELINAHGDVTTRKLVIEAIEGKDDGDRSRAIFEWPADVKGTKLLTFTHKKADDDQWLYLPAVKRVKRISSNNKSGSFMGSEFAYEDLASAEVEKYGYKLLGEEAVGGRASWKIERIPVDRNSGYRRQVVFMDKEYLNPLRIDFYDRKDELLKTGVFSGYRKHGKLWRFGKIEMSNVQTKKRSVLTWNERLLGAKLDPAAFESTALEE
jgi:outer membrane lipoprotein-sorting protein